jgi:hypothetical protein
LEDLWNDGPQTRRNLLPRTFYGFTNPENGPQDIFEDNPDNPDNDSDESYNIISSLPHISFFFIGLLGYA